MTNTPEDRQNAWSMAAQAAAYATTTVHDGVRRYLHHTSEYLRTNSPSSAADLYAWDHFADEGYLPPSEEVRTYERPPAHALPDILAFFDTLELHFVYRFYDQADRLLYIGVTNDPAKRFGSQHRRYYEFSHFVEPSKTIYEYWPTRQSALDRERETIRAEHPLYNIVHQEK